MKPLSDSPLTNATENNPKMGQMRSKNMLERSGDPVVVSVDAMGGDLGPSVVINGCAKAAQKNPNIRFLIHGPKEQLEGRVARKRHLNARAEIVDARNVIAMDDKPSRAIRSGRGSSMWSALSAAKTGEADTVVSCGNTGALMALSLFHLRPLPGVNRPAIAVLWPSRSPQGFNIMLDVGADIRAEAEDLVRYALMGVSYARSGLGVETPRVGLLNVGTEEHKGRAELKLADEILREQSDLDFVYCGYVEGGDIPGDEADVIVTDGFTGNIALKTGEGTAQLIGHRMREAFSHTPLSRFASLLAYTSLSRLKKRIDPRRVNGGVFLGLNGTVVKSHGSADATGVAAAIKLAVQLAEHGFTDDISARISKVAPLKERADA